MDEWEMENLHDYINSGILLVFGFVLYFQKTVIDKLKITLEAIDPQKMTENLKIIAKRNKAEYQYLLETRTKEMREGTLDRLRLTHLQTAEQYDEMFGFAFQILMPLPWTEREKILEQLPKTKDAMRKYLSLYDSGELDISLHP